MKDALLTALAAIALLFGLLLLIIGGLTNGSLSAFFGGLILAVIGFNSLVGLEDRRQQCHE